MLERIQTTMSAIKTRLLNDTTIKQLLYYDSNDALSIEAPEKSQVAEYVTLRPIFEFENKENFEQNSMINIYTTQCDPIEESKALASVLQINIVTNVDNWELVDDKIRPLQIADRVISLVNGFKFTASNKLVFSTMTDLIISKKMVGYALLFSIIDGSGEVEKF